MSILGACFNSAELAYDLQQATGILSLSVTSEARHRADYRRSMSHE